MLVTYRSLSRATATIGVLTLALSFALSASAQMVEERDTALTGAEWEAFNQALIKAVESDNQGVVEGALKQIAQYGDYMEFPELTVFEVMRIYRDHKDQRIRRLAIVALANMGSRWAIEFLDMLAPYETNETVKKTMENVVRAARAERKM